MEMDRRRFVIAIDGPSGVGKSTTARSLARELNYRYIDTGAMYRAVGLLAREEGVSMEDPAGLASLAERMDIDYVPGGESVKVLLFQKDVTEQLRLPGVGEDASRLSKFPEVRAVLVEKQRKFGKEGGVVMEGRDIGSVVFPDADLKIFLDADMEERALRRQMEWREKGIEVAMDALAREIRVRDERDQARDVAPLTVAPGAITIDNTRMSAEEVLAKILSLLPLS